MGARACVLIPSYCSWANLRDNLPVLLAETQPAGIPVLVVDDASPDDTPDRIAEHFPEVRLVRRARNGGFGEACNEGVRAADTPIVYLMNADVRVTPGFLEPTLAPFEDPRVFAVSSIAVSLDGRTVEDGPRLATFRRGHLKWRRFDRQALLGLERLVPTLYAVGAHVAVDRRRFLELGGFDPLYAPFYWEDVDLSYRAWKRGWRVLCEPRSRVHHLREGSDIERTQPKRRYVVANHRNRFLFTWKNLHDPRLFWVRHVAPVAARALLGWLVLDGRFYRALGAALRRLPAALAGRRRERRASVRSDADVLRETEEGWRSVVEVSPGSAATRTT